MLANKLELFIIFMRQFLIVIFRVKSKHHLHRPGSIHPPVANTPQDLRDVTIYESNEQYADLLFKEHLYK